MWYRRSAFIVERTWWAILVIKFTERFLQGRNGGRHETDSSQTAETGHGHSVRCHHKAGPAHRPEGDGPAPQPEAPAVSPEQMEKDRQDVLAALDKALGEPRDSMFPKMPEPVFPVDETPAPEKKPEPKEERTYIQESVGTSCPDAGPRIPVPADYLRAGAGPPSQQLQRHAGRGLHRHFHGRDAGQFPRAFPVPELYRALRPLSRPPQQRRRHLRPLPERGHGFPGHRQVAEVFPPGPRYPDPGRPPARHREDAGPYGHSHEDRQAHGRGVHRNPPAPDLRLQDSEEDSRSGPADSLCRPPAPRALRRLRLPPEPARR